MRFLGWLVMGIVAWIALAFLVLLLYGAVQAILHT